MPQRVLLLPWTQCPLVRLSKFLLITVGIVNIWHPLFLRSISDVVKIPWATRFSINGSLITPPTSLNQYLISLFTIAKSDQTTRIPTYILYISFLPWMFSFGWPFMWVNRPLQVSQLGQLSLSSFRGRLMSGKLQLHVSHHNQWWRRLVSACEVEAGMV